jgi:hypothetical protein
MNPDSRTLVLPSLVVLTGIAGACDLCGTSVPPHSDGQTSGAYAAVFEQFTHFGTVKQGSATVDNEVDQRLDSSTTQLVLGWRVSQALAVQASVPWVRRSWRRPEGFAIDEGNESGIGDAVVAAIVGPRPLKWSGGGGRLDALIALKLPTGSSDRLAEEENEVEVPGAPESAVHGHDLARGSGSWDLLLGLTGSATRGALFATGALQYAIRGPGDHQYRYANDLVFSAGLGWYVWRDDEDRLGVQLTASGEDKGKDTFAGEDAIDTATTALYLGPELVLAWRRLHAGLGLDLPVHQHVSAVQIVPDWRLRAGLGYAF